jgi:hypothetical protein
MKLGPMTDEHKAKIGAANRVKRRTPEEIERNCQWHTGRKASLETKQKMSMAGMGRGKGIPLSEEHKHKLSLAKKGNKHPNWRGGIVNEAYTSDWTETLRDAIRQRDKYMCVECGVHQNELVGRFERLDVHHIDYNKKNCDPFNLITLCKQCHAKTNYDREYWPSYFCKNTITD